MAYPVESSPRIHVGPSVQLRSMFHSPIGRIRVVARCAASRLSAVRLLRAISDYESAIRRLARLRRQVDVSAINDPDTVEAAKRCRRSISQTPDAGPSGFELLIRWPTDCNLCTNIQSPAPELLNYEEERRYCISFSEIFSKEGCCFVVSFCSRRQPWWKMNLKCKRE
ncbi:hypothetical protein BS78_10G097000 [Paspalum vaginatum]|nr:hypothetical protein BS78_10G097000 [Paspalum vaginatum]